VTIPTYGLRLSSTVRRTNPLDRRREQGAYGVSAPKAYVLTSQVNCIVGLRDLLPYSEESGLIVSVSLSRSPVRPDYPFTHVGCPVPSL